MLEDQQGLVTISNALTRAAYTLSLPEKRLLMLAVTKLDNKNADNQLIKISPNEYAEFYSLNRDGAYRTLRNATENLWLRTLVTDDNTKYRWIITSKYEDGVIEVEFHPRLKPHLLQLKNRFTQYFLHRAANFQLMYTWRLFELLMQYKDTGWLKISLDDFKKILDVPESYNKDFGKIREKVITPALKEIRKKDGLKITWKPVKEGRKVAVLEFKFSSEKITNNQNVIPEIDNILIKEYVNKNPELTRGKTFKQIIQHLKEIYPKSKVTANINY